MSGKRLKHSSQGVDLSPCVQHCLPVGQFFELGAKVAVVLKIFEEDASLLFPYALQGCVFVRPLDLAQLQFVAPVTEDDLIHFFKARQSLLVLEGAVLEPWRWRGGLWRHDIRKNVLNLHVDVGEHKLLSPKIVAVFLFYKSNLLGQKLNLGLQFVSDILQY